MIISFFLGSLQKIATQIQYINLVANSNMGLIDYIGDNSKQIDATEYEEKVREEDPNLLQHDENIVFAFKGRGGSGRDHYMLTTTRVILRDKRGVTGKRVRYTSVPYTSIRAFSLETAGSVDTDQELKIHAVSII